MTALEAEHKGAETDQFDEMALALYGRVYKSLPLCDFGSAMAPPAGLAALVKAIREQYECDQADRWQRYIMGSF